MCCVAQCSLNVQCASANGVCSTQNTQIGSCPLIPRQKESATGFPPTGEISVNVDWPGKCEPCHKRRSLVMHQAPGLGFWINVKFITLIGKRNFSISWPGDQTTERVDNIPRKPRKQGSHWLKRHRADHNNNNNNVPPLPSDNQQQDHHSNARSGTKRREFTSDDATNKEPTNEKPQFEDKPNHKQKQSNHEQVSDFKRGVC